jgi:putative Holliday junction resolvase
MLGHGVQVKLALLRSYTWRHTLPVTRPDRASRVRPALRMRIAAIDLGAARVGLAISDELGLLAHPRPHLSGKDRKALLAALIDFARAEGVDRFLVGLPRRLDGSAGPEARAAQRFAGELAQRSGIAVELVDEWLTTRQAGARLREAGINQQKARARIDSAAAAVMLQSWLDGQATRRPERR